MVANAALSLTFSTLRASPGEVVTVRTGGSGALAGIGADGPSVQVFLIDADEVNPNSSDIGVTSPGDTRLIRLGDLAINDAGNGTLRFAVPDVRGGEYTTVVHCVPCAPFSGSRELLATGLGGRGGARGRRVLRRRAESRTADVHREAGGSRRAAAPERRDVSTDVGARGVRAQPRARPVRQGCLGRGVTAEARVGLLPLIEHRSLGSAFGNDARASTRVLSR